VFFLLPGWGAPVRSANPELLDRWWTARWISVPNTSLFDYGVYHFRRTFDLAAKPSSCIIHVTADNRYQLFINGRRVVWGPARGDLLHWRYETVDLAPHLRAGRNVLAALVWNFAEYAPVAQVTNQTGFLLQGDTEAERAVDTGKLWRCIRNEAYRPLPVAPGQISGYYCVGPGDRVDGPLYPWGWELADYDDSQWKPARVDGPGGPKDGRNDPLNRWRLEPRPIPFMEESPERFASLRRATGITVPSAFPGQPAPVVFPANTKSTLLLDQSCLTTAYPELLVSGGKGAAISIRYAEKLRDPGKRAAGNRNQIEGKQLAGNEDLFLAEGGPHRLFRPLWWRTYRYIELNVATGSEPLTLEDLRGVYTGYPLVRRAKFDAGSEDLERILTTGWRTMRLCAHETYMDCPYYEQLQYTGDARPQAVASYYMSGDGRLARNAIEQLDATRAGDQPSFCRAPSHLPLYIPSFSLWWVGMVYDYWMYQDDAAFVKRMLPGVRATLSFFSARQRDDRLLGPLPWWNFIDWVRTARGGGFVGPDGSSAVHDLQMLLCYDWAARMEEALGSRALAQEYRQAAGGLRAAIRSAYFDPSKSLFADTREKAGSSQHANALAVLAGVSAGEEARGLIQRTLEDPSLAPASIFFRYYVNSAMVAAGSGDRYLERLDPYHTMLTAGLTTWTESGGVEARSDCHAWGAQPNIELFRTVLGVDSAAPGFRRLVIRPHLGKLSQVSGAVPHPRGEVRVSLRLREGRLEADVNLPGGIEGEFIWKDARRALAPGENRLVF